MNFPLGSIMLFLFLINMDIVLQLSHTFGNGQTSTQQLKVSGSLSAAFKTG